MSHLFSFSIFLAACLPLAALSIASAQSPDKTTTTTAPRKEARFLQAGTLNLDDLIGEVLRANPSIEAMEQTWRAAAERPTQATSLADPMLAYATAPGTIGSEDFVFGQSIEFSQQLPWPGKLRLRGEIESEKADAAKLDADALRERLIERTRSAFFEFYHVRRAIEINTANFELTTDFQKIAESKYATGKATRQDALQAEVERFHLEHRAVVLERMRKAWQARLNTLLHRSPEKELPPPPGELRTPEEPSPVAGLMERAARNRPNLRAMAHRVRAAEAGGELARRERLPDFKVMGVYNSLWQGEEQRGMVGVGINLPLGRRKLRAREAEAVALARKEAAEFEAAVDAVQLEVVEAHDLVAESVHIFELYRDKFLPAAEENLIAARNAYEASEGDFLSLITARKSLMLVQLGADRALSDYHKRRAQLDAATGFGLLSPSSSTPTN